jgi:hypothetical protein
MVAAPVRAVLGVIATGARRAGSEAADGESGADSREGEDPGYAVRHAFSFGVAHGLLDDDCSWPGLPALARISSTRQM